MTEPTDLIKLTDADYRTYKETQWGPGVTHMAPGTGHLCSEGWVHAYRGPPDAVFMDPLYGSYLPTGVMWRATGIVGLEDRFKVGCTSLTTIEIIEAPTMTAPQRVAVAILCVREFYKNAKWNYWAENWLSGEDRSLSTTKAAGGCVGGEGSGDDEGGVGGVGGDQVGAVGGGRECVGGGSVVSEGGVISIGNKLADRVPQRPRTI